MKEEDTEAKGVGGRAEGPEGSEREAACGLLGLRAPPRSSQREEPCACLTGGLLSARRHERPLLASAYPSSHPKFVRG